MSLFNLKIDILESIILYMHTEETPGAINTALFTVRNLSMYLS